MPQAIINTIHAMINKIYTIIIYPMPLLTIWCYYQLTNSCDYQQNPSYYQTPHIIINTSTYYSYTSYHTIIIITTGHPIFMICRNIINHIILLSDTYVIIKQMILLSNNSRYYQTPHIIINTSTYYS